MLNISKLAITFLKQMVTEARHVLCIKEGEAGTLGYQEPLLPDSDHCLLRMRRGLRQEFSPEPFSLVEAVVLDGAHVEDTYLTFLLENVGNSF